MTRQQENSKTALIDGVSLVELRQISDERGAVLHMLRADAPEFTRFGECYFSEVLPGAVKGWKRHHLHTHNVAVPVGRLRMVLYDGREVAATRGQLQIVELGRPDSYLRMRIPPGIWYAFGCIGSAPALLVNCSDLPHDPSESETRKLDDPEIPYVW